LLVSLLLLVLLVLLVVLVVLALSLPLLKDIGKTPDRLCF
jgi:hypothetical protein